MKTKVLLLALLAQLFTLSALAYDALVNGIYYDLNANSQTATVTYKAYPYNSYSGSITIPTVITYNSVNYKVTTIGSNAFNECRGLTSVSIPSSITTIYTQAFYNCTSLTSVTIPASVKKIFWGAFRDCSKLASISIPSSVTLIDCYAFDGTPWRESWLASQQEGPCYINSVLYTYKGTMPPNTTVVVKDGTTCIAGQAFEECSNLVSVEIPQSVTSICGYAFKGSGLKGITFPTSLSYLGESVLRDCTDLIDVEIPAYNFVYSYFCQGCTSLISATLAEGTKTVGHFTFADCTSLTTVTLPSTITTIYGYPFRGCNNLSTVKAKMITPPSIDSEVFTNRFLATLIVPEGCKEAYQAAEYWQDFKEIIEMVSVSGITLSETNVMLDLATNTSITLTATVLPENAMNKSIAWSSSNPDVARVDDDGKVTAVGLGQAVITASATDGSGISASCTVTVANQDTPEEDTDISLLDNIIYPRKILIQPGTTITLSFMMKNSADIRGFLFDLYLPEGMTAAKNSKGKFIAALNKGRLPEDDEHTLTIQELADGGIRFICNSQYEEAFTGEQGTILTLQVNIAEEYYSEYPVVMKAMRLTEIDANTYYEHDYVKKTLKGVEPAKCATPVITYSDGKLRFYCETEGVQFVSTITDEDIKSYDTDEVELSATYTISVYATKTGRPDSDVATGTLCWIEQQPATEGFTDEEAVMVKEVKALPVLIQTQGGTITLQGAVEGTPISVYGIDGRMCGSSIAEKGCAMITTSLQPGSVAVVKIGEKAVKVLIK